MPTAVPILAGLCLAAILPAAELIAERAPGGGIQPQMARGADGSLHLITYQGPEAGGDLLYRLRPPGAAAFGAALPVASRSGSALAVGAMRGAHLALGRDGWVHVAWMGSQQAQPKGPGGATPMLYARLKAGAAAFEAQRNLMTWATGLDGGPSLAADDRGRVHVTWTAGPDGVGEDKRSLYVAASADDGATFAREYHALAERRGTCACCAMRAGTDAAGGLYVLFRAATLGVGRDMMLGYAATPGAVFATSDLEPWSVAMCPMSTAAMVRTAGGMLVAWQGENGISWARVAAGKAGPAVRVPGGGGCKHPALAEDADGTVAVVWTEGTAWKRGGSLHWQLYDPAGAPLGPPGRAEGVPVWSIPTVAVAAPGRFLAYF